MPRMVGVRPDAALSAGQHAVPVCWLVQTAEVPEGHPDAELAALMPPRPRQVLRSFGHDADGVHWLLTRGGTPLHRDPAYARYSHQLVLRNDGGRVRGLPRFDDRRNWHPPMVPGSMYALDTHSPHQGLPDPRMAPPKVITKLVIAVDRDELLKPAEAWPLLRRLLLVPLPDTGQTSYAAPRSWGEVS